ncbi:hypothetical protein [Azospirillum agricola]|uniref:hypothetical protein n=1 Tax=Azospirillum agricola TaxID=1720247 RepID=UPI000A0F3E15|nr:hypothetical protein [Azospirillum agricola]SMH59227.1 uncharacterized protein SAMN02982994_4930 [Azospirillum lipoferum]
MLSFSKLLLLALIVGAVWFGWRWVSRVNAIGRDRVAAKRRDSDAATRRASASRAAPQADPHTSDAEDMEKCPECGAYVAPRSAVSCGRPACPYGR